MAGVELIADPIATANVIPSGMELNPILDWIPIPVLGIPLWVPITLLFILLVIATLIYWILRMGSLASVRGWGDSLRNMTQDDVQVWVISRVQKLTIECMTIKDNILSSNDPNNIIMYHVNSAQGIINVGGARAVVVSEDYDQNRDFIAEIALCNAADGFNDRQEQFIEEVDVKYQESLSTDPSAEKPKVVKPICDFEAYEMYGKRCLELLNPNGLIIPAFNLFNPNKFRKYFPRGCSGMWFGGELIHDARKLNLKRGERSFWDTNLFLMISAGIALAALIVAWIFPMGVK